MKRLAIVSATCLALAGCKKMTDTSFDKDEKVQVVNQKGNLSVDGSGGGFGAQQAVRKAAARAANDVELDQLYKLIQVAMTEDPNGRPPSLDVLKRDLQQGAPQIWKLVQDEVIILTGNQMPDGIFAYTQWPQRAEKHYVITRSGRQEMSAADLTAALQKQGSPVKLSN